MAVPPSGLHGAHLRSELVQQLGRRSMANALRHLELVPLWRGVVVEASRLLDPWTRAAAALLSAGPESVVSGPTAAQLHGCRAVATPVVHILLPYGRKVRSRNGLVVHHSAFFTDDVVEINGVRVLVLDRVVADLLCGLAPRDALAVTDEALRLAGDAHEEFRQQVANRLQRRLDPRGTVRGRGLLDLASRGAESPMESEVRLKIIEYGFPLPEVNWPVLDPWGKEIYRLDLAWPALQIALEYDGYDAHAGRSKQDEARREDLRKRGWSVVVVAWEDLRDFCAVANKLRAAFARRGYTW